MSRLALAPKSSFSLSRLFFNGLLRLRRVEPLLYPIPLPGDAVFDTRPVCVDTVVDAGAVLVDAVIDPSPLSIGAILDPIVSA